MAGAMRCAAALLLSSVALAEPVAPIEISFSDSVPREARERLLGQLRQGLAEAGLELLDPVAVRAKLNASTFPAGCVVGPCLRTAGTTLAVKYVLFGSVAGVESSFDVTLTMLETAEGALVAQSTERCDVCGMTDVEGTVQRATAELLQNLKARPAAPKQAATPPPTTSRKMAPPKAGVWRWKGWKWVALGVGAASVGVGAYLTQVDGRCLDDACSDQRSTGAPGMVAVGSGVVVMGAAGYLFLFRF
jgi:hypothetical protein